MLVELRNGCMNYFFILNSHWSGRFIGTDDELNEKISRIIGTFDHFGEVEPSRGEGGGSFPCASPLHL